MRTAAPRGRRRRPPAGPGRPRAQDRDHADHSRPDQHPRLPADPAGRAAYHGDRHRREHRHRRRAGRPGPRRAPRPARAGAVRRRGDAGDAPLDATSCRRGRRGHHGRRRRTGRARERRRPGRGPGQAADERLVRPPQAAGTGPAGPERVLGLGTGRLRRGRYACRAAAGEHPLPDREPARPAARGAGGEPVPGSVGFAAGRTGTAGFEFAGSRTAGFGSAGASSPLGAGLLGSDGSDPDPLGSGPFGSGPLGGAVGGDPFGAGASGADPYGSPDTLPGLGSGPQATPAHGSVPFPGFHTPDQTARQHFGDSEAPAGPTTGPMTGALGMTPTGAPESRSGYRPARGGTGSGAVAAAGTAGFDNVSGDTVMSGIPPVPRRVPPPDRPPGRGGAGRYGVRVGGKPARKGRSKPMLLLVGLVVRRRCRVRRRSADGPR